MADQFQIIISSSDKLMLSLELWEGILIVIIGPGFDKFCDVHVQNRQVDAFVDSIEYKYR